MKKSFRRSIRKSRRRTSRRSNRRRTRRRNTRRRSNKRSNRRTRKRKNKQKSGFRRLSKEQVNRGVEATGSLRQGGGSDAKKAASLPMSPLMQTALECISQSSEEELVELERQIANRRRELAVMGSDTTEVQVGRDEGVSDVVTAEVEAREGGAGRGTDATEYPFDDEYRSKLYVSLIYAAYGRGGIPDDVLRNIENFNRDYGTDWRKLVRSYTELYDKFRKNPPHPQHPEEWKKDLPETVNTELAIQRRYVGENTAFGKEIHGLYNAQLVPFMDRFREKTVARLNFASLLDEEAGIDRDVMKRVMSDSISAQKKAAGEDPLPVYESPYSRPGERD